MISFVTVWVLTVTTVSSSYNRSDNLLTHYQLQYASQETCLKQAEKIKKPYVRRVRCDFQQIPVVVSK